MQAVKLAMAPRSVGLLLALPLIIPPSSCPFFLQFACLPFLLQKTRLGPIVLASQIDGQSNTWRFGRPKGELANGMLHFVKSEER